MQKIFFLLNIIVETMIVEYEQTVQKNSIYLKFKSFITL